MAYAAVDLVQSSSRVFSLLLFVLLILTSPSFARRSGGGGYGRYSHSSHGGGGASYPTSTGLSGTHTSGGHSYPHSGLSGSGHSYPQSAVSGSGHSYPQPGVSVNGGHSSHSYPQSTGFSGNNNVQKQHVTHQQQHNTVNHVHKTEVHHHYNYVSPQRVSYGSVSYPVYHAQPPVYVYQYRDSGSRFDNLLTGLALYNLGRMSANNHYYSHRTYVATPGEVCKLGILRSNGDYEETRIDCKLMSSFIWDSEMQSNQHQQYQPSNPVSHTTSVVNVTQVQVSGGPNNSTTTVMVTNTTVVDALEAKGKSIQVTPTMTCYMIRVSRDSSYMKREIKCGVLQAYSQNSFRYNSAESISMSIFSLVLTCQLLLLD